MASLPGDGRRGRQESGCFRLSANFWLESFSGYFSPEETEVERLFFCRNWYSVKPQLFRFLEMLALNESSELEPDLARCILYHCHCN